jgi:hypothetical protein
MQTQHFPPRLVSSLLLGLSCLGAVACSRNTPSQPTELASSASAGQPAPAPLTSATPAGVKPASKETPIVVAGHKTGYSRLEDDRIVRTEQLDCPIAAPRKDFECRSPPHGGCGKDSECTAQPNGYCTDIADGTGCRCHYGCQRDSDCKAGEVSLCGDPAGTCVASNCTNESCAEPSRCSTYHNLCHYVPFTCLDRVGSRECSFAPPPQRSP